MTTPPAPWRDTYRRLLRSAGSQAGRLRASLCLLLAAAVCQGLSLACIVPLFVHVTRGDPWRAALAWLAGFTLLAAAAIILRWRAQGFDYRGHMARATHELRVLLGEQLRRMPLEALQAHRTGGIAAKLLGGVDEQMNYALTVINLILGAAVTPATTALALLAWDWRLGMALMLVFPVIVPLYRWRRPALDRGHAATGRANEALNAELLEYMQGLPVCLATGRAGAANERLRAGFEQVERLQREHHRRGAKPSLMVAAIVESGMLAILGCGMLWVTQGSLAPAALGAVLVLVARFAEPLATFVNFTTILALIEAALARIEDVRTVAPLPQWPSRAALADRRASVSTVSNSATPAAVRQPCAISTWICRRAA
ncbi:ABC transporter ATP-binding protein [Achromobacter xylosoxidans]